MQYSAPLGKHWILGSIIALSFVLLVSFTPGGLLYDGSAPRNQPLTAKPQHLFTTDENGFREFIQQVYRTSASASVELDSTELEQMLDRMRPAAATSMSGLFHALPLFGRTLAIAPQPNGKQFSALDVVLNARTAEAFFPNSSSLVKTRYGVRIPEGKADLLSIAQNHVQAHRGQALAVLARLGVPLTTPLQLPHDDSATVAEMFSDMLANFQLEGEVFWDAIAIALYLPPTTHWQNRFGKTFSLNELALSLTQGDYRDSPCAGTHALIALAVILRVNERVPILSDHTREEVCIHLQTRIDMLCRTEEKNGGWGMTWYTEDRRAAYSVPGGRTLTDDSLLLVTGHHLEWIALCPPQWLEHKPAILERGCRELLRVLREHGPDPNWIERNYCPATHALSAVRTFAIVRTEPNKK